MQEGAELVENVNELAKTVASALEFFKADGAAEFGEDKVAEPLQKYLAAEKELKLKAMGCKTFLNARQKDVVGNADATEKLKDLKAKVEGFLKINIAERTPVVVHEQKHIAKNVKVEVAEKVSGIDAEVAKATEACKDLIEGGGIDMLVDSSCAVLARALTAHMKEKEMTVDALFKEAAGKAKKIKAADFAKWIGTLVEKTGKEELGFPDERKTAVAKKIAGKDGVSEVEFKAIFHAKYAVLKAVTVTEKFEVTEDSVTKLEPGSEVTLFGEQKDDEKGLVRSECKTADGKTGWVTIKQNKGGVMLTPFNAFKAYTNKIDAVLAEQSKKVHEIGNFLNQKMKEGGPQTEGPLADARKAMQEHKDKAKAAQTAIDKLKKDWQKAKSDWQTTERNELNAHIDAKNKAAAEETVAPARAGFEAFEQAAAAVVEAAKALTELDAEAIMSFASPSGVVKKVDELAAVA